MRRIILLLASLLVATTAGAQTPYEVSSATVNSFQVCNFPEAGFPCINQAAIFKDAALTQPFAQPVSVPTGTLIFYITDGATYRLQVNGPQQRQYFIYGGGSGGGGGGTSLSMQGGTPLVNNGNFELPNFLTTGPIPPFGWDGLGCDTGTQSYDTVNPPANTTFSLHVHWNANCAEAQMANLNFTNIIPGQIVTATGWVRSDGTAPAAICLAWEQGGGSVINDTANCAFSTSTSWTFLTVSGVAQPGQDYLIVDIGNTNNTTNLDSPVAGDTWYQDIQAFPDTTSNNNYVARTQGEVNHSGSTSTSATIMSGAGAMYRASINLFTTTVGTGGTVTASLTWNDGSQSHLVTTAALNLNQNSTAISQEIPFFSSTSAINYSTTVSGATGSPVYRLQMTIERITFN